MNQFIPEEIISQIRSKIDIMDVVSNYLQVLKAGSRYKALCPFHKEKTPSFVISRENQTYHCFGCGKGGNVFTFVMEKENLSFPESVRFLAQKCGVVIPENASGGNTEEYQKKQAVKERLLSMHKNIANWYSENLFTPEGSNALAYLRKRNIPDDIISKFNLGFAPDSWDSTFKHLSSLNYSIEDMLLSGLVKKSQEGKLYDHFRNRVTFPITNEYGEIIAFSCRTIVDDSKEGKYVNSPETPIFKKGKVLYAFSLAKEDIKKLNRAILCEGQIDVIAMHRANFTNAIAPQGTAFTEEQSRLIKRFANEIHICFDGDSAGTAAALRALDILLPLEFEVKIVKLPPGEDPDSIYNKKGRDGLLKLVEKPQELLDFIFTELSRGKDLSSPVVKSQLFSSIVEKLSKIQNNILRTTYVSLIAEKFKIPSTVALSEVKSILKKTPFKPQEKVINTSQKRPLIDIAEEKLLELVINDGNTGKLLDSELPCEFISNTQVGNALNMAISMSINDEWEKITGKLHLFLIEHPDNAIARVLSKDKKDFEKIDPIKAVTDCIKTIKREKIKEQISELKLQLKAIDSVDREDLLRKITSLQKEASKANC